MSPVRSNNSKKPDREAHFLTECASVIFARRRVIFLCSDIMLRIVILPTAVWAANIISRKPQDFHTAFRKENITSDKARNITFDHRHSGYRILSPIPYGSFSDNTRIRQRKFCAALLLMNPLTTSDFFVYFPLLFHVCRILA